MERIIDWKQSNKQIEKWHDQKGIGSFNISFYGFFLMAKPEEIKSNQQSQKGDEKEKSESQDIIVFQKKIKT